MTEIAVKARLSTHCLGKSLQAGWAGGSGRLLP